MLKRLLISIGFILGIFGVLYVPYYIGLFYPTKDAPAFLIWLVGVLTIAWVIFLMLLLITWIRWVITGKDGKTLFNDIEVLINKMLL